MSKTSKNPARKSKKTAAKKVAVMKERAPKEAAATTAKASRPPRAAGPRDPRLPAPGTTVSREYHGRVYTVRFLEAGVEVDGTAFKSLSAAARHVTGAKSINGYLWLHLTDRKVAKHLSERGAPKAPEAKAGDGNDLATAAGQRAALEAAGLTKQRAAVSSAPKTAKAS